MKGKTPNQLFTAGLLRLRYSGFDAVNLFEDVSDEYGQFEEGESHNEEAVDDDQGVSVPATVYFDYTNAIEYNT